MVQLHYVALYGGFLVIEHYRAGATRRTKTYTVPDARLATPFPDWDAADRAAKWASHQLYPPDLRYFAILAPAFAQCLNNVNTETEHELPQSHQQPVSPTGD